MGDVPILPRMSTSEAARHQSEDKKRAIGFDVLTIAAGMNPLSRLLTCMLGGLNETTYLDSNSAQKQPMTRQEITHHRPAESWGTAMRTYLQKPELNRLTFFQLSRLRAYTHLTSELGRPQARTFNGWMTLGGFEGPGRVLEGRRG